MLSIDSFGQGQKAMETTFMESGDHNIRNKNTPPVFEVADFKYVGNF